MSPDTIYDAQPQLFFVSKPPRFGEKIKFRTGPSLTSNATIEFINGGDMQWSPAGLSLTKAAANKNPLFAIVGGDIAYANGDIFCYRRWVILVLRTHNHRIIG